MHDWPALWRAVAPGGCAEVPGGRQPLGSTIADKMPDKCDDKLWGRWICGQSYYGGDRSQPVGGVQHTFSRTIGEGGYEHVRIHRSTSSWILSIDETKEWRVDEKWHPAPKGGGKLAVATCDGWNEFGYRILNVYDKNPDGSERTAMKYFVDSKGVMHIEKYEVWWVGDKAHQKRLYRSSCTREP